MVTTQITFFNPIVPDEFINISKKLKFKKSQGHDGISTTILKDTINSIAASHVFNISFLIFKAGNSMLFNNYRPISILPAFSQLLEKTVYIQLWKFLDRFKILFEHQYGFRQKHSAIHPIIHFLNSITDCNDLPSKDITFGIFIDLSKAFDTIDHSTLLTKLEHFGIRGIPNEWFKYDLTNRKQFTNIKGCNSCMLDILCGVPQGSILGPLLFLLNINDVKSVLIWDCYLLLMIQQCTWLVLIYRTPLKRQILNCSN